MIIAEAGQSARETLNNDKFGRTAGICEALSIGSIGAHRFQLIAVTGLDGDCESVIRWHFRTRRVRAVAQMNLSIPRRNSYEPEIRSTISPFAGCAV